MQIKRIATWSVGQAEIEYILTDSGSHDCILQSLQGMTLLINLYEDFKGSLQRIWMIIVCCRETPYGTNL